MAGPEGAIEVTAEPGDAVFFDRRIWHGRSRNYSRHTRKAVFFGYTYRWTAIRDDITPMRAGGFSSASPAPRRYHTVQIRADQHILTTEDPRTSNRPRCWAVCGLKCQPGQAPHVRSG